MPAQSLMFAVWANNHGGDGGDSVKDVRQARQADRSRWAGKQERLEAAMAVEERSEGEIEDGLLAQLGLSR